MEIYEFSVKCELKSKIILSERLLSKEGRKPGQILRTEWQASSITCEIRTFRI